MTSTTATTGWTRSHMCRGDQLKATNFLPHSAHIEHIYYLIGRVRPKKNSKNTHTQNNITVGDFDNYYFSRVAVYIYIY